MLGNPDRQPRDVSRRTSKIVATAAIFALCIFVVFLIFESIDATMMLPK